MFTLLLYSDASPAQLNTTPCSFIITTTGREEGRCSDCLSELQSPLLDIRYNNIHTARTITMTIITVIILLYYYYLSLALIYTRNLFQFQTYRRQREKWEIWKPVIFLCIAKLLDNLLSPTKRNCRRYFLELQTIHRFYGEGSFPDWMRLLVLSHLRHIGLPISSLLTVG